MDVVLVSPCEEMGWIYASGVVAMMADQHSVGDHSDVDGIADAMGEPSDFGQFPTFGFVSDLEASVSVRLDFTRPDPAIVRAGLLHPAPELLVG